MGATQSIVRNVSIGQPKDDSLVVIKISDNVIRKIKGELNENVGAAEHDSSPQLDASHKKSAAPPLPGIPTPQDELVRQRQELARLEASWRIRLKAIEEQNLLLKAAAESLAAPLVEPDIKPNCAPSSDASRVIECYKKNILTPLRCSREVRAFVKASRVDNLLK